VLVLAMAIYLFREVRSHPAQAQSTTSAPPRAAAAAAHDSERDKGDEGDEAPAEPSRTVGSGTPAPAAIVRKINPGSGSSKINEMRVEDPEEPPPGGAGSAVKLDAVMLEANKAYDRGDFDEAKSIANKVLAKVPGNPRMLRILVSVACIDNDASSALAAYHQLPATDQAQMRTRCSRYGIDLK